MTQVVEADVLQSGILENFFVKFHHRVGVVHLPSSRRGEHIRVVRMLFMLLDQQVYCFLRDGYPANRGLGLGPGEGECPAGLFDVLFADGDCPVLNVQVISEEGNELTLAQTTDQFQIEHGQYVSGIGGIQIGFQLFRQECLHLNFSHLWRNAVIGGIAGN